MDFSRRQALLQGLFGTGMLGLRALATGLPAAFLAKPFAALAEEACNPARAQYLVLCTSGSGDPLNANVPGTYTYPTIGHSLDPTMAKTPLRLGALSYDAAKPWADMPQAVLDRTTFFHHTTLTNNHANQSKVMRLMGAVRRQEMLVSMYAKSLSTCLGTVQHEPVTVGASGSGELLSYEGRTLPKLSPSGLRTVLARPTGLLGDLPEAARPGPEPAQRPAQGARHHQAARVPGPAGPDPGRGAGALAGSARRARLHHRR